MNNITPPLSVWIKLGIVLSIFFSGLYGYAYFTGSKIVHEQFNEKVKRVLNSEYRNVPDSVLRVVAIGSSLTIAAIHSTNYFRKNALEKYNTQLQVIKLADFRFGLNDFTIHSEALQLITEMPPDIICFEENFLLFDNEENNSITVNERVRSMVHDFALNIRGNKKKGALSTFDVPDDELEYLVNDHSMRIEEYYRIIDERNIMTEKKISFLVPFLQKLEKQSTKIVILNFPRPVPIEKYTHSGRREDQFQKNMAYLRKYVSIENWKYENELPFTYYGDYAHMNVKGRMLFSEWLLQKIIASK